MEKLSLNVTPLDLPLVHPFKIARGEETRREHRDRSRSLRASSKVSARRPRSSATANRSRASPRTSPRTSRRRTIRIIWRRCLHAGIPAAARAGLDLALHDLIGKDLGKPLYALLGLDPSLDAGDVVHDRDRRSADDAAQSRRSRRSSDSQGQTRHRHGIGTGRDDRRDPPTLHRRDTNRRQRRLGRRRSDRDSAGDWNAFDVEFCEQPIPAGHPERAARRPRKGSDSDRYRRRLARRLPTCRHSTVASTASTSSWRRPAEFAARSR